jgi:hypothetical protein
MRYLTERLDSGSFFSVVVDAFSALLLANPLLQLARTGCECTFVSLKIQNLRLSAFYVGGQATQIAIRQTLRPIGSRARQVNARFRS